MSAVEKLVTPDSAGSGSPDSAGAASGLPAAPDLFASSVFPASPRVRRALQPLPCPFCGSANVEVSRIGNYREQTVMVTCMDCLAVGPTTAGQRIGEAVYCWNTRQREVAAGAIQAAEDVTFFLDI
jgi:predicted RNA-binding Zn-ribbon protein involved in translation (DUF1610 family)